QSPVRGARQRQGHGEQRQRRQQRQRRGAAGGGGQRPAVRGLDAEGGQVAGQRLPAFAPGKAARKQRLQQRDRQHQRGEGEPGRGHRAARALQQAPAGPGQQGKR